MFERISWMISAFNVGGVTQFACFFQQLLSRQLDGPTSIQAQLLLCSLQSAGSATLLVSQYNTVDGFRNPANRLIW